MIGRRRSKFVAFAMALTVSCAATVALADVMIITKDGKNIRGEITTETDVRLFIATAGSDLPVVLLKENVESIRKIEPISSQFQQRRAALEEDDLAGRYKLAQELYETQIWLHDDVVNAMLRAELDALHRRFPDDQRVPRMVVAMATRREQIREARDGDSADQTGNTEGPVDADGAGGSAPDMGVDRTVDSANDGANSDSAEESPIRRPRVDPRDRPVRPDDARLPQTMLNEKQINVMKVFNLRLDRQPRITVPRDVLRDFMDAYREHEDMPRGNQALADFRRAQGHQILEKMFQVKAREFYGEVNVIGDPDDYARFRKDVLSSYLLAYCGTMKCHGNLDAGDFFVFRNAPKRSLDEILYTNFLILYRYQNARAKMLNSEDPAKSLLLEYGMRRVETRYPHPEVDGWFEMFRDRDERRYGEVASWMQSLPTPPIVYPVDYRVTWPRLDNDTADVDAAPDTDGARIEPATVVPAVTVPADVPE